MTFQPPHTTIGRKLQLISQVLGTRPESGLVKKLDRFATEEQFDIQALDELKDEILRLPFAYPNDGKKHILEDFLQQERYSLNNPALFIKKVPADIYPNKELLKRSLAQRVAGSLHSLVETIFINEPEICKEILLAESPLTYGFSLVLKQHTDFINHFHCIERDKIQRWIAGTQKPSMKELFIALENGNFISDIRTCEILCIAMILEKSEELTSKYYKLQDFFKKLLIDPEPNYNNTTEEYFIKIQYIRKAFLCSQILIRKEAEKTNPDFNSAIDKFRGICTEFGIDPIASEWRTDLLISLQRIFEGNFKEAIKIFEHTIPYAFYTVDMQSTCIYSINDTGTQFTSFYNIALAIGAIEQDRPFLKMMKNYGILFGLFGKPIPPIKSSYDKVPPSNKGSRNLDTIVEDWEPIAWANNFFKFFPLNLIKNKDSIERFQTNADLPLFIELENLPKGPVKPYKKNFLLGRKTFPQLAWFTYVGNIEAVKTLLESNANVNSLTSSSESALLLAIEKMVPLNVPYQPKEGKILFDLISQYQHDKKTINTATDKNKLTCLGQSIWTGDYEIVEKIIKMGAEVDALQTTDRKSPLYKAVQYYTGIPKKFGEKMVFTPETIDGLRRGNEFMQGLTNDQVILTWLKMQHDPNIQEFSKIYRQIVNERYEKDCPKEKRLKIIELLLRWGADPNLPQNVNGLKGYTPLMLAAEKNCLDLFKLMIENPKKPGNPYQKAKFLPQDNLFPEANCWGIAKDWKSYDILKYLEDNKKKFK